MKSVKNYLILCVYSILFIPIWGMTLLEIDNSNRFSITIGLFYTLLSNFYIRQNAIYSSIKYANILIFIGPIFYLITMFFSMSTNFLTFLNPIFFAFLLFLLSFFLVKNIDFQTLFFTLFIVYFYAFHLHPYWKSKYLPQMPTEYIEKRDLKNDVNLNKFTFVNSAQDSIVLNTDKEFIVIETWNETCAPCIAAMDDLQPLFEKNADKVAHYYLYEAAKMNYKLEDTAVFSYPNINDKGAILIDKNLRFFHSLGMKSYPYFLLFNKKGQLIDYFKAYNRDYKSYFENRLNGMWAK